MDHEFFTMVFKGDITKLSGNPMKIETPFGCAIACGVGNAFDTQEVIEDMETAAQAFLDAAAKRTR